MMEKGGFELKRQYIKPVAKHVDFSYDEQVVATSIPCVQYNQWSYTYPSQVLCQDNLRGIPYARMYSACIQIDKE